MNDREHATMLIRLARNDLNALRGMLGRELFVDQIYGFHAQQVVEKCLKAWLTMLGQPYPKIHDLTRLIAMLDAVGQDISRLDGLIDLNPFAVQFRYVYSELDQENLDREALLIEVRELFDRVEAMVRAME